MVAILPYSPVKEKEDAICGGLSKLAADGQAQSQNKNILCFNLHEKNIFPLLLSLKRQKRKKINKKTNTLLSNPFLFVVHLPRIHYTKLLFTRYICINTLITRYNLNLTRLAVESFAWREGPKRTERVGGFKSCCTFEDASHYLVLHCAFMLFVLSSCTQSQCNCSFFF